MAIQISDVERQRLVAEGIGAPKDGFAQKNITNWDSTFKVGDILEFPDSLTGAVYTANIGGTDVDFVYVNVTGASGNVSQKRFFPGCLNKSREKYDKTTKCPTGAMDHANGTAALFFQSYVDQADAMAALIAKLKTEGKKIKVTDLRPITTARYNPNPESDVVKLQATTIGQYDFV